MLPVVPLNPLPVLNVPAIFVVPAKVLAPVPLKVKLE